MSLSIAGLFILAGLGLLYLGGEWLVRGSAGMAVRLGVSALVIGLTVVAFGTSSPELAVSLSAALTGMNDVAIGNVVGSNVCNIALILGLAATIRPIEIHARLFRIDVPVMIGCTVLMLVMLDNRVVGRIEGIALIVGIALYLAHELWEGRKESKEVREEYEHAAPKTNGMVRNTLWVFGGLVALAAGAKLFVDGAVTIGFAFGLSPTVVALTVVALGTSLPELAASVMASVRNQGDIAVGNVIGSNIFNILAILGITSTVTPLSGEDVLLPDLIVVAGVSFLLLPMFYTGFRLSRAEGVMLLVIYFVYIGWRIWAA